MAYTKSVCGPLVCLSADMLNDKGGRTITSEATFEEHFNDCTSWCWWHPDQMREAISMYTQHDLHISICTQQLSEKRLLWS
jgi:hypothetical protein